MSVFRYTAQVTYPMVERNFELSMTGAMTMMQEAAAIHSDLLGYSFRTVEKTRVHWVLVGWHVRMEGKARWGEKLHVDTWPRTMSRVTSERDFEITDERGQRIAIGTSNWILVNADTGRAARVTPEIAAAYPLTTRAVFSEPPVQPELAQGLETCGFTVQWRDIDTNRHMNNLVYLAYARQALPEELWDTAFSELTVKYSRQLLLGDTVRCVYRRGEKCHKVEFLGDTGVSHAQVLFWE